MPNKTFLVQLTGTALQHVSAATIEIHGKHLAFLTEKGKLAGAFLFDLVESWNEISIATKPGATAATSGPVAPDSPGILCSQRKCIVADSQTAVSIAVVRSA